MDDILKIYEKRIDPAFVAEELKKIKEESKKHHNTKTLKQIFNLLDITTLNTTDSSSTGEELATKVTNFHNKFPNMPDVAAICVYPTLVEVVREFLDRDNVKIASVTAGFPSSQTYLAIKAVESKMAIEKGADEIDIVMSVGTFLEENYKEVFIEIGVIKEAVGEHHVKVILETGALPTLDHVRIASIISMEARADFIKTSTGKITPAATPEAAYVMTEAIADYYKKTGKKVGFKPAGGVATVEDALLYYAIVKHNLGDDWLNNELFRIGASRLANNILTEIVKLESGKEIKVEYF
ncbi:MAG: deoxyribose-phosphate aldolase [Bacteroidetes bacterium GWF2_38_335]|nr:MAG: deoxyribose-phosphate aldolase [Bacteroidetes bacterium GWF2_38_335]OFY76957.1 MAG: deoxyribose-phosphate aldolase [Bacteroidetes bacterium RIFOXYA12_FULL_38_20]HBS86811.1 deoxyribose-phosphate aldolase [Bacteroidales bacterium]